MVSSKEKSLHWEKQPSKSSLRMQHKINMCLPSMIYSRKVILDTFNPSAFHSPEASNPIAALSGLYVPT